MLYKALIYKYSLKKIEWQWLLTLNLPFPNQSGMIFSKLKTNHGPVPDFKGLHISGNYTKRTHEKFLSFWQLKVQCHVHYIPAFCDCIIKTRSVMAEESCSKKLAGKSVNVEFSANVDSESDKENTADVIGNEEYDFLFGSDDEEQILSTDPNFTPTKNWSHDKNADELTNVQQKTAVDKNAPEGFSINNWRKGIVKSCQSFHPLGHLDSKLKYQMTATNFIFWNFLSMKKLFLHWHCRPINMPLILFKLMLRNLENILDFLNGQKMG